MACGAAAVLRHAQAEVRQAQADVEGDLRVHRRAEQHQRARVQVHELHDERRGAAHGPGDVVAGAVHELGEAVHHDVGAVLDRRDDQRRERVVHDQHGPVPVRDLGQRGDVRDPQRGVRHRLAVEHPGPRREGTLDGREVGDVHERRRDTRLHRQVVVQQRERSAVHRATGDDVVARVAELRDDGRDGCHAARRAVARFRAFVGGDLAAEHVHRRVEMPAVEVAAPHVRAEVPLEDLRHRLGVDHRERGARLDGHVHAAVLAELVPQVGERPDRIELFHGIEA